MSVTATTTELPAAASSAVGAAPRHPDAVEYPEGHWIAQSVWHGDAVGQAMAGAAATTSATARTCWWRWSWWCTTSGATTRRACSRTCSWCSGSDRGGNRSSYKVWEEGRVPDFVLEVASPSTAEHGALYKAGEYARIGVREYWRLDPEGSLMGRPLEGYVASGSRYGPVEPVKCTGRATQLRSRVLGLDLRSQRRDGATVLVFRDPLTGEEFDGTLEEAEQRRRAAEKRASAAEERVRALEERLRDATARNPSSRLES